MSISNSNLSSLEPRSNLAPDARVLHVYSGNLYGGIETLLITLARMQHLIPQMERQFALCFPGRLRDSLLETGAAVYDLGPVRLSRPWTVLRARARLKRLLRDVHFDAVMLHACWPHVVFAPTVRRTGIRLALGVHDLLLGKHWLDKLARWTSPPDVLIANSHYTGAIAAKLFRGIPLEVVHHPVPLPSIVNRAEVRRQVREELGTPEHRRVILQASRLERWKGHAVHVAALGRLQDQPDWEAWFAGGVQKAGEAEFLAELKASAERGGVADRVRFLGQRNDVPRLMAAADLCCQPNIAAEPFGIAFVEALASGLPVVTTNYGGGAEIVTPKCGILTPPGDVVAVAEALRTLIEDSSKLKLLSEAAPIRAVELCDPARQIARQAVALVGGELGRKLAREISQSDPALWKTHFLK